MGFNSGFKGLNLRAGLGVDARGRSACREHWLLSQELVLGVLKDSSAWISWTKQFSLTDVKASILALDIEELSIFIFSE